MKKLLLILTAVIMTAQTSFAQSKQTVAGTLLDEKDVAMPFANILLMKAADSTLAKASVTDIDGAYIIENITDSQYFIKASMVGYDDFASPLFTVNEANAIVKFQPIKLQLSSTELKEVVVSVKKPFIEQQVDRTILNVENSIVGSGSTALEVLEKAPGVMIDRQSDQIKLKNKTGVLIMIDGKRSYLSNDQLTQVLRNMSSDQISSIEIITNPSSKYDAAGTSGIINIKLKKNQAFGTNGSFSASAGQAFIPDSFGDLSRGSVNLNLNNRSEKFNIYGNIGVNRNTNYNDNNLYRIVNFENTQSIFDQLSQRNTLGYYYSGKFGVDYFVSKKTTIGIMLDGGFWDGNLTGLNRTEIKEVSGDVMSASSLVQNSALATKNQNVSANFNIKHEFDGKGKELTFDADYSGFYNDGFQTFNTDYFDANNRLTESILQRNTTPTYVNIYAAKVDFTLPLENKIKLETGLKSGFVKTDNDFLFEQNIDETWTIDKGKTNTFVYDELVNAAYINVGKQWEKWSVQAGLRAEHTYSKGNSVTLNKVVERNYLSLFPTFFLNQNISEDHSVRYSYSRRIDRPNYSQLNPFLFFLDPFTFEEGNPFLQPQFTDNLELTYTYKGSMSLALGYSNTVDYINDVIVQDDATRTTKQTSMNLDQFESYSANLSLPVPVTKWWMMINQISAYYNRFQDDDLSGGQLDVGQFAYNFYTSSTFTLPKNWTAEVNMWYNSPNVYGIVQAIKPQYAVNAGVSKSFWDKKGRLKLNISDIFLTSFFNGRVDYQNVDLNVQSRWTSRRASVTFSYNFGNQNVKATRRRSTATDTEKNRAGGNN
ncbi:MAG: TonB-dependent receptor [Spirosomataceae bacterium]